MAQTLLFQKLAGARLALALVAALVAACDNHHDNGSMTDPRAGHLLIADQFNNRVIEIDTAGNIVWHFGNGPSDITATSVVGVNDAQAVGSMTLIAGTGAPPGTEPACPDAVNGCPDNRVLLVDGMGVIKFQYGTFGTGGAGDDQLNTPVQATYTPRNTILISDQANQRIIEVNLQKQIVWQYGTTGTAGNGANQLSNPNSAELLANGNVLIADESNNRAIEVKQDDNSIVATYTAGGTASGVAFASRLPSGNTLLTDSNNNRIVEVDNTDNIVWQYATNTQMGSNANPLPTRAVRLANGDTLISDQFNHRVIVVDAAKNLVASYGNLNAPGYGTGNASQGLNAPYDAKVIGDFTGLTPPQ